MINKRMLRLLSSSVVLCATGLVGCATQQPPVDKTADPAYQALVKSAKNIEQSLVSLAEAEQYEKMKNIPGQPRIFKQVRGMEQFVTMPWNGTLEQAVSKLAAFSGFEVKFMGKTPTLPILVMIGKDSATVSDHLRNVGIQAGDRADVIIDPAAKIVEVRYGNAL